MNDKGSSAVFGALGVLAVFAVVVFIFGGFYTVGAGERVVIYSSFHGVEQEARGEGFHTKMPIFEDAITYNVKSQLHEAEASAASRDLQDVSAKVVVQYRPDPKWVPWIHQNLGKKYADIVIDPAVQETFKAVTAKYDADELIENRPAVKDTVQNALRERLTESHLTLEQVSITDFDFSDQFNQAIEAKVTQQQRALEELNRLRQVEYQAQQRVVQAQAEANATLLAAGAQAEAARIINEQLTSSPMYISYLLAQKWDGRYPLVVAGEGMSLLLQPNLQSE